MSTGKLLRMRRIIDTQTDSAVMFAFSPTATDAQALATSRIREG